MTDAGLEPSAYAVKGRRPNIHLTNPPKSCSTFSIELERHLAIVQDPQLPSYFLMIKQTRIT